MTITIKEIDPMKKGFHMGAIVIHPDGTMIGMVCDNDPYGHRIIWTDGASATNSSPDYEGARLFHGTITVD